MIVQSRQEDYKKLLFEAGEWAVAVGGPLHEVLGSGVLYLTAHGRVVITCAHVIRQLQHQDVHIRLSRCQDPQQRWWPAGVLYCAPPDHTVWDLAVLTLQNKEEDANRDYDDRTEDLMERNYGSFQGFPTCTVEKNRAVKDSAVVMLGYPVPPRPGYPTPRPPPLTARLASVINTFNDENLCRELQKTCVSENTGTSRKEINKAIGFTESIRDGLVEDFGAVALLLAGSASPGMSGGPILRMTSKGLCLVGLIVTSVREARSDGVAGVLAVPAQPVVTALHIYHNTGDEAVFERILRRSSPLVGRLWPQALHSKL